MPESTVRTRPSSESARTALSAPDRGGREPDLAAARRPGEPVEAGPLAPSPRRACRRGRGSTTSPRSSSRIGCSAIARWRPSGERRTRLTLRDAGQDAAHRELDPDTLPRPSPERTTAKSEPSAAQSAATRPSGPPSAARRTSGARARTPLAQEGHLPGGRDGRHRGVEDRRAPASRPGRSPRRAGPGVRRPTRPE